MSFSIAVLKERAPYELRVAATPDTVKKLIALGASVVVEQGAGHSAGYADALYTEAGAKIAADARTALQDAQMVLKVQRPLAASDGFDELALFKPGQILLGMLNPHQSREQVRAYALARIDALAMEFMPRITRAQNMDVLSSQANLAGYRAVIEAAEVFSRALPMMMTAAGTIPPAKVMVMGAGVAGLQAIATARRMGAVVCATDVRPVAKEQVQSLGASFVMVENEETKQAETSGGYAKEMSDDYKRLQAELIAATIKKQDIVICTALIPGRAAPRLITEEMLQSMKPGSVVVDLAVENGGNCALARAGEIVEAYGVKIVGYSNLPSRIPFDASALYARNLLAFISTLIDKDSREIKLNVEDELVKAVLLTRNGEVVHSAFTDAVAA